MSSDPIVDTLRRQIVQDDEYQMAKLTERFRGQPGIVVDIGAHHGIFSQHLLTQWPEAECHLFEPIEENSREIPRDDRLVVWKCAVAGGYDTKQLTLYRTGNSGMWSADAQGKFYEARIVPAIGIHNLFTKLKSIQILKMDVEGYEWELLYNAYSSLSHFVEVLVLEDHSGDSTRIAEQAGFEVLYQAHDSTSHPIMVRK